MNSFTANARDVCVFVCVCVCPLTRTIIILKKNLICSFSSIRDQERPQKYAKEKKRKKNRPFLQTKTRSIMMLRRRQSHPLLFLFYLFLLISFLFLPSCSNAQEEEGKCPLDIAKIDLSGLGNACNADDPGTFFISLFLHV